MIRSAHEWFDFSDLDHVRFKSRDKLIPMEIALFLDLALPGFDPDKKLNVDTILDAGGIFESVPMLMIQHDGSSAQVIGHEGRHRARGLFDRGYTHIPVLLHTTVGACEQTIRWSEQTPTRFDYCEEWPEWLYREDGKGIPVVFPVMREDAAVSFLDMLQTLSLNSLRREENCRIKL